MDAGFGAGRKEERTTSEEVHGCGDVEKRTGWCETMATPEGSNG